SRLVDIGGCGAPLFFAHANGYPVGSYRQLLETLRPQVAVTGMQQRPLWSDEPAPARLDWQQLRDDLLETVAATQPAPVWLMGHSMGAVVATLAGAAQPGLFRGLVLIDPVFFAPEDIRARRALSDEVLNQVPLVARTLTRPQTFSDHASAFAFYRPKRSFQNFTDRALQDYVEASLVPAGPEGWKLAYPPAWEAAAYRSAPEVWEALAAIRLPVLGLRGSSSDVLSEAVFKLWQEAQPHSLLRTLEGGHLLPLEHPRATAEAITAFLQQQDQSASGAHESA
ncbi:MAG: alpha/beta hydrolase, partial [Halieaceae bacterium]|nr:alpha/beta hydrolase [Halieaceae bacterium]